MIIEVYEFEFLDIIKVLQMLRKFWLAVAKVKLATYITKQFISLCGATYWNISRECSHMVTNYRVFRVTGFMKLFTVLIGFSAA